MHHGVIFNYGSAKACSPAIFETCFSYDKDIWIAATDYYMNFYIIVLFPLTAVLQFIKFYSFIIISPDESRGYIGFRSVAPPPPPP